jgi:hypothetical protein
MGNTFGDNKACRTSSEMRLAMPWKATTTMSLHYEFVMLARQPGANVSELCR